MKVLSLISLVLVFLPSLRGDLIKEVPRSERDRLVAGQSVVVSTDMTGLPWPKLSLYRVVNAPPAIVSNLFTDYAAASTYIPGMLAAKVIATNPDGTKDVRYTVKVPVLMKMSYVVRNTFSSNGQSYSVTWTLLQSAMAKSSDGSLRIEPYAGGRTLMCYSNLCVPITNLVAGLKNQALVEAKNTVLAIATEAERRANQATVK